MLPDDFSSLEVSRYELRLQARESVQLPAFLGSTLRGAFGHALKEAVCVMSHRNCDRCMVTERCLYPYLFETPVPLGIKLLRGQQQAPHPFILTSPILKAFQSEYSEIEEKQPSVHQLSNGRSVRLVQARVVSDSDARRSLKKGDELKFGLVLMGRAVEYLPYVVYAVSGMATRGLGASRGRFDLVEVALIDEKGLSQTVYFGGSKRVTVPDQSTNCLSDLIRIRLNQLTSTTIPEINGVRVQFLTPARIRVEGDLQVTVSFDLLVRNLLRRLSLLSAVHGKSPLEIDYRAVIEASLDVKTSSSDLRWWDWERYSNRQKIKMNLGGLIGEIRYVGETIHHFLPLIIAGEILHVGAGTSFGLGKYQAKTFSNKAARI
jgi:hypothetical protein